MVYIESLNKRIFPYYLAPKEDELFTSWVYRLSHNHNIKPIAFAKYYFKVKASFWNRDLDLNPGPIIIEKVNKHTILSKPKIESLFLKKYEGILFEKINNNGYNLNILPLGINHRKRKKYGQLYCPSCLKKNAYYRTSWRLTSSIVCEKCNDKLYDSCLNCGHKIIFFRNNIGSKSDKEIDKCYSCGVSLSFFAKRNSPLKEEIKYQTGINRIINLGYKGQIQYSFLYFFVLNLLAKRISTAGKKNKLKYACEQKYGVSIPSFKGMINHTRLEERKIGFIMAYKILNNWPREFNNLRKMFPFNRSQIDGGLNNIPYFLYKTLRFPL